MNALCASYQQRQAAIFFECMDAFGYSRLREIERSGRRSESACSKTTAEESVITNSYHDSNFSFVSNFYRTDHVSQRRKGSNLWKFKEEGDSI